MLGVHTRVIVGCGFAAGVLVNCSIVKIIFVWSMLSECRVFCGYPVRIAQDLYSQCQRVRRVCHNECSWNRYNR